MIGNTNRINVLSKLFLSNTICNNIYQELLLLLDLNSVPKTLFTQLIELWSQSANESIEWSDAVRDNKVQSLIKQLQHAPAIKLSPNSEDLPKTEADVKSGLIPFYAQFNPNYGSTDISNGNYDFSFTASFLGHTWATSTQTDENFDIYYFPYSQFTLGPGTALNSSGEAFYSRVSYIAKLTALIDKVEKSNINQYKIQYGYLTV